MAQNIKHVGRLKTNNRKAIVAFRVIPDDPLNCLVVMTESLEAGDHDVLISLVDSPTGQNEYELGSAMMRTKLPDGSNMLARFSQTGKLMKMPTDAIEMTPNFQSSVNLKELNQIVADHRGVTVADLAVKDPNAEAPATPAPAAPVTVAPEMTAMDEALNTAEQPMTDDVMAASLRSQADAMFKEAKALREQAEELVPTKRKTKSKESA